MDSNENIRSNTQEEVIVLGVASVVTQGAEGTNEPGGVGGIAFPGISEE
ncbi:benenodin family lasso peptide [Pseudoxanthomonas sp. JBR18]|nr:benenodin family lasso peptide [Pseudoxanthomonas sp. JBR18]WCE06220.1 benenodin family lasso peptide [Pseudoxanthomonas sp. JBR18]